MPIKKKKKKEVKSGFFDAAKIAEELGKAKKSKKVSKDRSVSKTKTPVLSKVVVIQEKTVVDSNVPQTKSLVEIKKSTTAPDELEGFDDLSGEGFQKHEAIKQVDAQGGRGIVEMIGGLTMVLILVEVVVIIGVLVLMFFAK